MAHWTKFLPEGNRIFKRERRMLDNRLSNIQSLKEQLQNAEKELQEFEAYIEKDAQRQYSIEEIQQAKAEAQEETK